MEDLQVSREGVLKLLKGLGPHKAVGPDDLSLIGLKEMVSVIGGPITTLVRMPLEVSEIPSGWETTHTTCMSHL